MSPRPLIAILDYGIGNLHSAQKGFEHVGADARLTADRGLIADAAGVVLPGVGAFAPCMAALGRTGLDGAVHEAVVSGRPFMGICVGMQVLFSGSDEAPGTPGLGLFDRRVTWISGPVKRPQMQWNVLRRVPSHPMFAGLEDPVWVYFVHSLAPERLDSDDQPAGSRNGEDRNDDDRPTGSRNGEDRNDDDRPTGSRNGEDRNDDDRPTGSRNGEVIATCDYGGPVVAAIAKDNVWTAQFHPEKSSRVGLRILANFVARADAGPEAAGAP